MRYGQRLVRQFRRIRRGIHVNLNIMSMLKNNNLKTVTLLDGDQSKITGNCVITGEEYSCTVPTAGLQRWLDGDLIQNAMPDVSLDDREFLISGISPTGWDKAFG